MATPIPPKVNPGDLIKSSFIDQIIDVLISLDQRISHLESLGSVANPVVINGFTAVQPLHVGDPVEVDGFGFMVPAILNQVSMGGVPVTSFALMSGATKLNFQVPPIPNLSDTGTSVTVTVTNANGGPAISPPILVFPQVVVPKGQTQLSYTNPPVMPFNQPNITAGQNYVFTFSVTAATTLTATYAVTPTITGTGWAAQLVETSPIQMAPGTTQQIHVRVTAAAGSGALALSVVDTTPGTQVSPGNFQLAIAANAPPPTPENRVRVTLVQAGGGASIVAGVAQFKRGISGGVQFTIMFTETGDYTFNPAMRVATGWTRDSLDVSGFHATQPPPGQTVNQTVNVFFTAGAAAGNTDLLFTVARASDLSVTYALPVTVV